MDFFNFLKFSKDVPLYPEKINNRKQLAIKDDNTVMRFIGTNSRPYVTIIFVIEDVIFSNSFYKVYLHFFDEWQSIEDNFLDVSTGVSKNQFRLLKDVICNKLVQIQEYHFPINEKIIGKYVCNKKVWNAARIIQKTWRKYKNN